MAETTGDAPQATGNENDGTIQGAADALMAIVRQNSETTGEGDGETQAPALEQQAETQTQDETPAEGEAQAQAAPETQQQSQQPQKFKVKADGQELEVPLDELLKGYSREADYTRKTQALAAERQKLEQERQGLNPEREQYKTLLNFYNQQISAALGNPEDLDKLRTENPQEYAVRSADRLNLQQRLGQIQAEQQRIAQEDAQKAFQQRQQTVMAELQKLHTAVPEWKDPAKFQAGMQPIYAYAAAQGFDRAEVDAITDHRVLLALRSAAAYDALQKQAPQVQKKVEAVKVLKPSASTSRPAQATQAQESAQRLQKTGRVEDAAAVMRQIFAQTNQR